MGPHRPMQYQCCVFFRRFAKIEKGQPHRSCSLLTECVSPECLKAVTTEKPNNSRAVTISPTAIERCDSVVEDLATFRFTSAGPQQRKAAQTGICKNSVEPVGHAADGIPSLCLVFWSSCPTSLESYLRSNKAIEAIENLADQDPRSADLVKLRFFAGLSLQDASNALGLTRRQGEIKAA